MKYLINGLEVGKEFFAAKLTFDIAYTGEDPMQYSNETDMALNGNRYTIVSEQSKWDLSESEYFLLKGISLTFKDPSAAIRRKNNGQLELVYDMDTSIIFIPLDESLFPYIFNGETYTINYLLLKAEEYDL